MLGNIRLRIVIVFLLCSVHKCYSQKYSTDKEMLHVLIKNKEGKTFSFNNSTTDYPNVYDYLKYLGYLKSDKDSLYKIITITTIWGENKHTINYLYVYNAKNNFLGKYKYLLMDELPIKIECNKLVYYKRTDDGDLDKSKYVYVSFANGLPKIICPGCDDPYNGTGVEIMREK